MPFEAITYSLERPGRLDHPQPARRAQRRQRRDARGAARGPHRRAHQRRTSAPLVLTGAGKGFCTGADLQQDRRSGPTGPGAAPAAMVRARSQRLLAARCWELEKPVRSRRSSGVRPPASALGSRLPATWSSRRPTSRFIEVFVRRGLAVDAGRRVPAAAPHRPRRRPRSWSSSATTSPPRTPHRIGLVNQRRPRRAARRPPPASRRPASPPARPSPIGMSKRLLNRSLDVRPRDRLRRRGHGPVPGDPVRRHQGRHAGLHGEAPAGVQGALKASRCRAERGSPGRMAVSLERAAPRRTRCRASAALQGGWRSAWSAPLRGARVPRGARLSSLVAAATFGTGAAVQAIGRRTPWRVAACPGARRSAAPRSRGARLSTAATFGTGATVQASADRTPWRFTARPGARRSAAHACRAERGSPGIRYSRSYRQPAPSIHSRWRGPGQSSASRS